jgi:acyl-CoA synthetase (AMP-forming)/AMP-acid ligase II/acyl carrier protein
LRTLVDALLTHAGRDPDGLAFRCLHDGELGGRVTRWSWSQLTAHSMSTAVQLRELGLKRGDRALLVYPDGLDFAQGFLGCLIAGVIPVPVAAQDLHPQRGGKLLSGIARVCAPKVALTTSALAAQAAPLLARHAGGLRVEGTDAATTERRAWDGALSTPDDVAFLQFTSGSTSAPKGVVITHRNISEHQRIVANTHRIHAQTHMISWLPTHHDMGLAGDLMMAVWSGRPLTMMAPHHFVDRPMRWLEAISGQPGARSGGPNFAFALVVRKLDREALGGLDLSTWETAHCGAEPIRREILEDFARALEPAGFRPSAFSLCYGLAEATLYVSDVRPWQDGFAEAARARDGFTASGRTDGEVEIAIVDMERARVADGLEGEIWVRSPNIARGYWEAPEATEVTFGARLHGDEGGSWLRTGDLGRVVEGVLYPTGRIKDLIICRGQNIYPQDVEVTVEAAHPALRPGCSAAFTVKGDDGAEALGVVAEVRGEAAGSPELLDEVMQSIRRAVGAEFGEAVAELSLIAPKQLLKTTSGKVMRAANRAAIESGSHKVLRASRSKARVAPEADRRRDPVMVELLGWLAATTGLPVDQISTSTPLRELGIDSIRTVELRDHLQTRFRSSFQLKQLGNEPTADSICSLLRGVPPVASSSPEKRSAEEAGVKSEARATVLPSLTWMRKP